MLKNLVHDQVKILLERMDTHPEEFLKGSKWDAFMPFETKFKHFTKLEQYLIRKKYRKLVNADNRQRAYDGILETLVFKEEEPRTKERYYTTSNHPVLGTPSPSYTVSPINIKEHIDAHVKAVIKEWGKD